MFSQNEAVYFWPVPGWGIVPFRVPGAGNRTSSKTIPGSGVGMVTAGMV